MRSKNTLIYSKYYILLEECVKYYNDYQIEMKQTEVNRLIKNLDITNNELKEIKEQNTQILNELKETNENLVSLQDEFNVIHDKLDERVPNAKKDDTSEKFVLLKHDTDQKYYIITRKKRTMKMTLDNLEKKDIKIY